MLLNLGLLGFARGNTSKILHLPLKGVSSKYREHKEKHTWGIMGHLRPGF